MAKICKRCGGSGTLLRNPVHQRYVQRERGETFRGFGAWFTTCTTGDGDGVKGVLRKRILSSYSIRAT